MTNEERLLSLIKTNDAISNAVLVERIQTMMTITEEAIKENPAPFNTLFTNVAMFNKLIENVKNVWKDDFRPRNEYLLLMGRDENDHYNEIDQPSDVVQLIMSFNENQLADYEVIEIKPLEPIYRLLEKLHQKEWIYVDAAEYQELIDNQLI